MQKLVAQQSADLQANQQYIANLSQQLKYAFLCHLVTHIHREIFLLNVMKWLF